MFSSIRAGLVHAWNDYPVRLLIVFLAAIMLLINGPFVVVIPVLSATRFAGGAAAFGIIMSAFGGGALPGMVLAGVLPKPPAKYIISMILVVISSMGIAWALLGMVTSTLLAALLALAMGTANGYIEIMLITLGAKPHTCTDAGAHDEPCDVCYHGPDPSFHSHSRCLNQTEPNVVPTRYRRAGGRTFTSGSPEFPVAREGYGQACNPLSRICLSDRG